MTPINELIQIMQHDILLLEEMYNNTSIPNSKSTIKSVIESYKAVQNKAKSLLPVEQQMMCGFAEWIFEEGYYMPNECNFWLKSGDNFNHSDRYTTTELLQLFTQQKDKDGK